MSRLFRSDDPSITPYTFNDNTSVDAMEVDTYADDKAADFADPDDENVKRTFQYSTGYPLKKGSAEYETVHSLRKSTGETLHRVHNFLVKNQEDDVPCFNALYTAYKTWFIDIGIERSAHVLDRLTRLLAADTHGFKFSGTRKEYPRPLLVRRANLYHFQRLRFNEHPRAASDLDKTLLLDLAASSTSIYTDIRRTAQSAGEQAMKSIVGAKPLIIPPLLDALEAALAAGDHPRMKGAMFSLLFGSLAKPIGRNWHFAPRMIKLFIRVSEADRPSIQKLIASSSFTIQDMTKAIDRMVILDEKTLDNIWPEASDETSSDSPRTIATTKEEARALVPPKKTKIQKRRAVIEEKKKELALELIESIKHSHWKKASRTASLVIGLDYRFETIATEGMLELVIKGAIDPHPQLRALYAHALIAIHNLAQTRALVGHKYENYLLDSQNDPDEVTLPTRREDDRWTQDFLESFAQPNAEAYVDVDYPGWLVWQKQMRGYRVGKSQLEFDDIEKGIRKQMGSYIDRHWISTFFGYMKQEPRDQIADRFRMSSSMIVAYVLDLMSAGLTVATWDDFKDLTQAVYGDGSDKHQHRAMAEICGALIQSAEDFEIDMRQKVWEFVFPIVRRIFSDGMTPENTSYWLTFVTLIVGGKDPRRAWPLVDWLAGFRLDMGTNAAFKESSKITLLQTVINAVGWHFQLDRGVLDDFLEHIDHPYKGVREVMGTSIATIFRTRYHESYKDIPTLLEAQKNASSVGTRPYQPTEEFSGIVRNVFDRLEKWRLERPAGIQTPTPYTQASKTALLWLDTQLASYECTMLVPFFPDGFMQQLLHMMDIKEDPELQSLAYHVFRHLPNIPHRPGEDEAFVGSLIKIGTTSTSWHQRLRVLINMQVIYFRHLFIMPTSQAKALFVCVRGMLHDTQLEVRLGAAATLSGMVRCSPLELRTAQVTELKFHFTNLLVKNTLPKKPRNRDGPTSGTSTPTQEQNRLVLARHAAVLGLGALVQAFPYQSPPPEWLPEVLATLAGKAASDPGMVGKSVKTALSDFKKTRQDTWHVDVKVFKPEQLEDLEGVLWKSYFA